MGIDRPPDFRALSGQNKAVAGRQHMTVWSRLEDKARITAWKAASRRASPPL